MSWYSSTWRKRKAISLINTAGGATKDANVVIPKDWDEFWDATPADTTGLELRVVAADGRTLLNYSVDDGSGGTFSRANRNGRLQIDGYAVPGTATECDLAWLYYDPTSTQGTGAVATTIASAITGYIELGTPSTWKADATPPRPGLDRPRAAFGKDPTDEANLWLNLTEQLELRQGQSSGRRLYEEPWAATYTVVNASNSAQAAMIDATMMRWVELVTGTGGREMYLRLRVKAGSDDTRYTALPVISTAVFGESTVHRSLNPRVGFRVRSVLET